ncbi:MAG: ABC transporter ATP-binding protein/permease [Oscillospiraceae bacterium]|nr:ABC transporter ATP-binding protein/permease [Oscillospiraceae bacterium]
MYTLIRLAAYILNSMLPFVSLFASRFLINILVHSEHLAHPFRNAIFLLLLISVVVLLRGIINNILQYAQNIHNEQMNNKIQISLMEKSMTVDMEFFDSPDYIDAMQAVSMDSMALPNIVWNIFAGLSSIISFLSAFFILGIENWIYPIILTIGAFPSAILSHRYIELLYKLKLSHINEERKMSYIQSVTNNKLFASDIRLFSLREYLIIRYQNIWTHLIVGRKVLLKRHLIAILFVSLIPEVLSLIILIVITRGIIDGVSTVGDYTLYAGLLATLVGSLAYAISSVARIYEDKLKVDTIKKFESRKKSVLDEGQKTLEGEINVEFKNVSFSYPKTNHCVLNNLSFKIKSKEKICLIGINGAGKSTIIKLLLRFYDVTEGQILINGVDIKEYNINSLRKNFSTFFQEYDNYAFTMRENVIISDLEYTDCQDKRVLEALKKVDALNILQKSDKGLDTPILRLFDINGLELSGGEAQKIALSRAVYRTCKCIIFDEPSSTLDPISELNLFESMKDLLKDKSALFTSHRLSIVHLSDRILLLNNGCITESGSHRELMELNGEYAKLYTLQASKYEV